MRIEQRDKRALIVLAVALAAMAIAWLATGESQPAVVEAVGSVEMAEKRLLRLRQLMAGVPGRQKQLEAVQAELVRREQGVLQADTAAQAQAQLLTIVRKAGQQQAPPLEFRGVDLGQPQPLGEDYGQVLVSVSFECRVEQLVNLLADLTTAPEIVAAHDLRISAANPKQKLLGVRLTVSGVVPRKLVPEKKGPIAF